MRMYLDWGAVVISSIHYRGRELNKKFGNYYWTIVMSILLSGCWLVREDILHSNNNLCVLSDKILAKKKH